jgi:guanylate kinase
VAGGRQVLQSDPGALCLFVDAPDDDELRRRLVDRGDGAERADARIVEAARERTEAAGLGYMTVVNADLNRVVCEVAALIAARLAAKNPR